MDLNCPGCGSEYDTIEREPQNLSCGCDLCLVCVEEKKGQPSCPEGHSVDWNQVTVSRRVLRMVQAAQSACPTHKGRPYDFWCPTCRVPLCGICAVSHKDICLRAAGGGIGSSNPSFYLIEMNNPSASEDLIRLAQEHSKAIEQSTTDLEEAIPGCLLKTPDEFAEYVQAKATEAIQNFYHKLEESIGDMYERYNNERGAALKEEEKRDAAVSNLAERKGNIDMGIMELNVAVQSFRDAEKEEKQSQQADRDRETAAAKEALKNNEEPAPLGSSSPSETTNEKTKARTITNKNMCEKAGELASLVQRLVAEQNNGSLKGSVSCSHIRHLGDLNVVNLEPLHPQWTTPDPPPKSCPLYRGIIRARPAFGGGGSSIVDTSTYYNENASLTNNTNHYSTSRSAVVGGGGAPPRGSSSSYDARDISPSSRRPRLMESLWREQLRENNNTNTSTTMMSSSTGHYSPPSSRLTTSSSANPMLSPGGSHSSATRSSRSRY